MKQIETWLQQALTYFSLNLVLFVLLLLISVAVLFSLGWIIAGRKAHAFQIRISSLESDLRNSKLAATSSQHETDEKDASLQILAADFAGLKATLSEKEKQFAQQKQTLEAAEERLAQNFENLANKIFTDKQKQFGQQSSQSMEAMLSPFKSQLADFRKRVDEVHTEQTREQASLKTQLESLRDLNLQITEEAAQLTKALKGDKKMQGNWGEIQVEMILDRSGLVKGQEYQREANFKDDENNNLRPDFIVNLPDSKHVIIDSKVSLVDFNRYVAADDDTERAQALNAHIKAVENHIRSLSDKAYPSLKGMNSPDLVLMFMPIEPAFLTAFQARPELYNQAFEKRIIVVTTSTLLATLKTISSLWSIERQNKSARQLAEQASKVYDKLRIVVERVDKLDQQLGAARKTCEQVQISLKGQGSLTTTIGKFQELGVRVKKELPVAVLDDAGLLEVSDDTVVDIVERLEKDV